MASVNISPPTTTTPIFITFDGLVDNRHRWNPLHYWRGCKDGWLTYVYIMHAPWWVLYTWMYMSLAAGVGRKWAKKIYVSSKCLHCQRNGRQMVWSSFWWNIKGESLVHLLLGVWRVQVSSRWCVDCIWHCGLGSVYPCHTYYTIISVVFKQHSCQHFLLTTLFVSGFSFNLCRAQ